MASKPQLDQLIAQLDTLSPQELDVVYDHITKRRRPRIWAVGSDQIALLEKVLEPIHARTATIDEADINAILDEALQEVRDEGRSAQDRN